MARRRYVNHAPQLTLAAQITNSATSLTISGSFSGWPTNYPFTAEIDKGTGSAETVLVTNIVGTTATITRGYDGSAGISHAAGATFNFVVSAIDFDEANLHANSNNGVHGVAGNVVGDSDVQTLTNKTINSSTLNAPIIDGNVTSTDGVLNVNGGVAATGDVSAVNANFSGAGTAASYTANGNGKVTGVLVPKTYTTEAAATSGGANVAGGLVWLTAPTTGPVGLYVWDTVAAAWQPVQTPQTSGFIGESLPSAGTSVTLATAATNVAGSAAVTFTLLRQTRVRIAVYARYVLGSTTNGRGLIQAGYNTGASANIASVVLIGSFSPQYNASATSGNNGAVQMATEATVLLAAGTYTAYAAVQRASGGSATDTASAFYTLVTALGNV